MGTALHELGNVWIGGMDGRENERAGWMHGFEECMALKNAWFGNKIEPEVCMALKHAWFV